MYNFTFSLTKKLLLLVLSSIGISILATTILFLYFDDTPLYQLEENILSIAITLMILLGTITYYLSTRISEPIQKLSDAAKKISEGDFGVRTGITSHDEIGHLSASFDLMAQKLQDSLIEIKGQKNVILQQEGILLQFFNHSKRYCVGIVDIVNSTKISANLSGFETSEFYIIFLNSLALIIKNFDGTVVKNLGDGLLFYFSLDDTNQRIRLRQCLDCCLALGKAQGIIAEKLKNNICHCLIIGLVQLVVMLE